MFIPLGMEDSVHGAEDPEVQWKSVELGMEEKSGRRKGTRQSGNERAWP